MQGEPSLRKKKIKNLSVFKSLDTFCLSLSFFKDTCQFLKFLAPSPLISNISVESQRDACGGGLPLIVQQETRKKKMSLCTKSCLKEQNKKNLNSGEKTALDHCV